MKLVGFVNATEDFMDHPQVVNSASDLMVKVFGEAGRYARSAVGMGSLPFGARTQRLRARVRRRACLQPDDE